ncbi:hypothetical protein ACSHWB_11940 [Lentzea sp. HUAS TT2]|uniref:hypothetical protein n=1 Tax=Lentzea sp. HUAS TT2 TaxID=3447454 RepID=UPI003F701D7F
MLFAGRPGRAASGDALMTQDVYFARKVVDKRAADALESAFGTPKRDAEEGEEDQAQDGPPDAAA